MFFFSLGGFFDAMMVLKNKRHLKINIYVNVQSFNIILSFSQEGQARNVKGLKKKFHSFER